MEVFEEVAVLKTCTDMGRVRLAKVRALAVNAAYARTFMTPAGSSSELGESSPTKALDALVLGNTLIGYGDNMSLENMMIIENLIKFSKLEADRETKDSYSPAAWHQAFIRCMEDMGCFVPSHASVQYSRIAADGSMKNTITAIIKAGVEAAKAAIPGATALGAVADSTFAALEKEPEVIKIFNLEVTKTKGVKLAIVPCEQRPNGLILTSCSSINYDGDKVTGGALFLDLNIEKLSTYQGSNILSFNPAAYAEVKDDVEFVLGQNRRQVLGKRFAHIKRPR